MDCGRPYAFRGVVMKPDQTDGLLATAAGFGVIGLAVGLARGLIESRHGSVFAWLGGMAAAALVAVLLGWGLDAAQVPQVWQWPIVGACAYIAEDALAGLRALGAMIRSDPIGGVMRILDALRGRGEPPK